MLLKNDFEERVFEQHSRIRSFQILIPQFPVGTEDFGMSPVFLQRPNKLLLCLCSIMWVSKVEKQWRFGNLRFDNPSTRSTKTT
jgi:hypothetical protein